MPLHASYEDKAGARTASSRRSRLSWPRGKWTHGGVGCSRWARSTSSPPPPPPHAIARCREVCLADVPVVTHLHGTELLMLEQIDQYIKVTGSRIELPASWTYAEYWAERLRATAAQHTSSRCIDRPRRTRGAHSRSRRGSPDRGTQRGGHRRFRRVDLTAQERLALLRQWLVDDPRGWDESGRPGSIRYSLADLSAFTDATGVLLYVGRFTAVKRLSLLLRAYAASNKARTSRALDHLGRPPRRVGGEHPYSLVTRGHRRRVLHRLAWP